MSFHRPVITLKVLSILAVALITATVYASPCFAFQSERCEESCPKPTAWNEFNVFELKVTVPGDLGYQFWQGRFDNESSDIQIVVERSDGQKITKGRILLIGGRVMAIQGPIAEQRHEIDALDASVLYLRLIMRLLGEALPYGPAEISGERKIDLKEGTTGIKFATPSAQGFIAAPWQVTGAVTAVSADDIKYDLSLSAAGSGIDGSVRYASNFAGSLTKVASAKIDDSTPLDGWSVLGLGVQTRKTVNGTTLDYGAAPTSVTYNLVADIRNKIAADDYPGEPDPTMNFTGFWKENCDNAFGLQIMRYGKDGKYSVTFCGPGGCGTAGEDGKNTFITQDPDYQVVSESELRIRNAKDEWDTYYRCTRETHPVLKYKED
jgi:hypothetical protein